MYGGGSELSRISADLVLFHHLFLLGLSFLLLLYLCFISFHLLSQTDIPMLRTGVTAEQTTEWMDAEIARLDRYVISF